MYNEILHIAFNAFPALSYRNKALLLSLKTIFKYIVISNVEPNVIS